MPSKPDPGKEPERPASDLFSSAETGQMLEEFRALVRAGVIRVTPEGDVVLARPPRDAAEPPPQAPPASEDDLRTVDQQLADWFERSRHRRGAGTAPATGEALPSKLRGRLLERMVAKMLEAWDRSPEQDRLLRDEVIDRVADRLLDRWTREPK